MCLARFCAWYKINSSTKSRNGYTLLDGETKITVRRKFACLRTVVYSEQTEPELFYFRLLMLHLPFRCESDLLVPFRDYRAAFMAKKSLFDSTFYGIETLRNNLENVIQKERIRISDSVDQMAEYLQIDMLQSEDNSNCQLGPRMPVGRNIDYCMQDEIASEAEKRMFQMFCAEMTDSAFATAVESLNAEQKSVLNRVKSTICTENVRKPLRLFVSGAAGTGKSFLIKTISEMVIRYNDTTSPSIVRAALTGVAARNISGITLHRAFILPVDHRYKSSFFPLKSETLQQYRRFYKHVNTLIIDEISMVSYRFFDFISRRLCEIKGNSEPFGGINVLLFGDFYQLKPVMDAFLFKDQSDMIHLFNDLFLKTELKTSMRQSNDPQFSEMLTRLRVGETTHSDHEMIRSRVNVHINNPEFDSAIYIFPTRDQVKCHNQQRLAELETSKRQSVIIAEACDYSLGKGKVSNCEEDAGGLPKSVYLLEGSRVMLVRNISCEDGLTRINRSVDLLCSTVDIRFDNITPIITLEAVSAKYMDKNNCLCERKQFPLILAWACTVHKVQGLTLIKAVIDIGSKVFQSAMAYVAPRVH